MRTGWCLEIECMCIRHVRKGMPCYVVLRWSGCGVVRGVSGCMSWSNVREETRSMRRGGAVAREAGGMVEGGTVCVHQRREASYERPFLKTRCAGLGWCAGCVPVHGARNVAP